MAIKFVVPISFTKAAIMVTVIEAVINPGFLEALAVAVVSAILSGIFLLIATHWASRQNSSANTELREEIEASLRRRGAVTSFEEAKE